MAINLPYPVYGKVYDTDGTTLIGSGVTVRLRNNSTNELLSTTTNSVSEYALDGGNFTSGYDNSDKFTVYIIYSNLEAESTLTVSEGTHQVHLTLTTVSDSTLINYTTIQNVYDELDGLGESDLSARRIVKVVQRAEKEIEEYAGISFKSNTATQEVYDFNQRTSYWSPEQLTNYGTGRERNDYLNQNFTDRLILRNRPVISITTLQRNTAGTTSTDSWETLTEQTGTGGDYILSDTGKRVGYVDFIEDKPRYGKRAVRITYTYGYSTTPKNIERLATMMAVRDILMAKISRSFFDTPHNVSLKGIAIGRTNSHESYMRMLNTEIDRLWATIGREFIVV